MTLQYNRLNEWIDYSYSWHIYAKEGKVSWKQGEINLVQAQSLSAAF